MSYGLTPPKPYDEWMIQTLDALSGPFRRKRYINIKKYYSMKKKLAKIQNYHFEKNPYHTANNILSC